VGPRLTRTVMVLGDSAAPGADSPVGDVTTGRTQPP
jgi:hypothetical protein